MATYRADPQPVHQGIRLHPRLGLNGPLTRTARVTLCNVGEPRPQKRRMADKVSQPPVVRRAGGFLFPTAGVLKNGSVVFFTGFCSSEDVGEDDSGYPDGSNRDRDDRKGAITG